MIVDIIVCVCVVCVCVCQSQRNSLLSMLLRTQPSFKVKRSFWNAASPIAKVACNGRKTDLLSVSLIFHAADSGCHLTTVDLYTLSASQLKRDHNSNPFKYSTTRQNIYHFNYTNYYLFNANYTSLNKIHSLVSKI